MKDKNKKCQKNQCEPSERRGHMRTAGRRAWATMKGFLMENSMRRVFYELKRPSPAKRKLDCTATKMTIENIIPNVHGDHKQRQSN